MRFLHGALQLQCDAQSDKSDPVQCPYSGVKKTLEEGFIGEATGKGSGAKPQMSLFVCRANGEGWPLKN